MNSFHFFPNPACCSYHTVQQSGLPSAETNQRKMRALWLALLLIISFAGVELVAGLGSHSLALLAEAGHLGSDGAALGIALLATRIAQLPSSPEAPFGYRRIEILAALVNSLGLTGMAVWIGWEAWQHLQTPDSTVILSLPMLMIAIGGLAVNSINARLLHPDSQHDLNVRGALLHTLADLASSVGVMMAAIAIWQWGWLWADSAMSFGVALLMITGALPLIHQSLHILLEKAPTHLDLATITERLHQFEGVIAVSHLRVWTIALGQDMLSAQITVSYSDGSKRDRLLQQLRMDLQQEFGIAEVVLQLSSGLPLELMNRSLVEQIEQLNPFPARLPAQQDLQQD